MTIHRAITELEWKMRVVITGNFVNIKVLCEARFEPSLFYRTEKKRS